LVVDSLSIIDHVMTMKRSLIFNCQSAMSVHSTFVSQLKSLVAFAWNNKLTPNPMQYFLRFVTECAWEVIVPMRLASALIVDRPKAKRIV
jgi:hypothetical protein